MTRQAYYARRSYQEQEDLEGAVVLELVHRVRRLHCKMGVRKLHDRIAPDLKAMGIKLGRDALFDLMREAGLLIRRRRRGTLTTDSRHRFRCYKNLLEGVDIERPEQVWVADITYIRLVEGFAYLSLITDAYSRRIMGYHLHPTLEAEGCLQALNKAIKNREYDADLIHHSDRGIQYCSHDYTDRLVKSGAAISMTLSGSAENAIAERVNGILKDEYLLDTTFESFHAALRQINQAVMLYNTDRAHWSLQKLTPEQAHQCQGPLKRLWKNYRKPRLAA